MSSHEFHHDTDLRVFDHLSCIPGQLGRIDKNASVCFKIEIGDPFQDQGPSEPHADERTVLLQCFDNAGSDSSEPDQTNLNTSHFLLRSEGFPVE